MGCSEHAAKPVMVARSFSMSAMKVIVPLACGSGAKGWMLPNSVQLSGSISVAALSFMVHEPSGIMLWVRDMSRLSSFLIYLIISVSEWYELKTASVSIGVSRAMNSGQAGSAWTADTLLKISRSLAASSSDDSSSKLMRMWPSSV